MKCHILGDLSAIILTVIILPCSCFVRFWLKAELITICMLNSSSQTQLSLPQQTEFMFVRRHSREGKSSSRITFPLGSILLDLAHYSNSLSNPKYCKVHRADHKKQYQLYCGCLYFKIITLLRWIFWKNLDIVFQGLSPMIKQRKNQVLLPVADI